MKRPGGSAWAAVVAACAMLTALAHPLLAAESSSKQLGRPAGSSFREMAPEGGVLVGLRLSTSVNLRDKLITAVAAIYRSDEKLLSSPTYGIPDEELEAVARPGYAVGAVMGQGSQRLAGVRLVFMRQSGDRLDPSDSYLSRWLGFRTNEAELTLGGDGRPLVGIQGYVDQQLIALGVIAAGDQPAAAVSKTVDVPKPQLDQLAAIAAIKAVGGRVTTNADRPGSPVVAVDLSGLLLKGSQLAPLRAFTELESLDLSNTFTPDDHVSLQYIAGLKKLRKLDLTQAYALQDTDLLHLRGLTELRHLIIAESAHGDRLAELRDLVNLETLETGGYDLKDQTLLALDRFHHLERFVLHHAPELSPKGLAVLANYPRLKHLVLEGVRVNDDVLAGLPAWEQLEELTIRSAAYESGDTNFPLSARGLKSLGRYGGLKKLHMVGFQMDREALDTLAALDKLEFLGLEACLLDDDKLGCLAHFRNLKALLLNDNPIEGRSLAWLKGCKHLRDIVLTHTEIDDDALEHLAQLNSIEQVRLGKTKISSAGLRHLSGLTKMMALDLQRTAVGDQVLVHLRGMKQLKYLYLMNTQFIEPRWDELSALAEFERLWLDGSQLTDGGLANLERFPRLKSLEFRRTHITDAGLRHLAGMKQLEELGLAETAVTDAGLRELVGLEKLSSLNLIQTRVSSAGLQSARTLGKLRTLGLSFTIVDDDGLTLIADLPELSKLYLFQTRASDAGVRRLQRAKPGLMVFCHEGETIPDNPP